MGNSSSSSRKTSSNKKGPSSTSTAIEKTGKTSFLSIGSRVFRRALFRSRKSQRTKIGENLAIPASTPTTSPTNLSFQPNEIVNPHAAFVAQANNAQDPSHEEANDVVEEPELLREASKRGKSERNLLIEGQEEQEQPQTGVQVNVTNDVPANGAPSNQATAEPVSDIPNSAETSGPNEVQQQKAIAAEEKKLPIEEQVRLAVERVFDSWGKEDLAELKKHVIAVRKMLAKETNPPVTLVRESEVCPILIEIMTKYRDIDSQIIFEALWAITNIASGQSEDTNYVVNLGALPILRDMLDHPSEDVVEQAIWCLGNIAGDSPVLRDLVLNLGINDHLSRFLAENNKLTLRRNAAWLLSNMCRGKPDPMLNLVLPLLNIAVTYIQRQSAEDNEVLSELFWAISYVSSGTNDRIDAVLETGVTFPICTLLLGDCHPSIISPAIRTIGNVLSGNDTQTQTALDHGTFKVFKKFFAKKIATPLLKEILWGLSNIAAGNSNQIQLILDDEELLVHASEILGPNSPYQFDIKKEASYILANLSESGSTDQLKKLAAIPSVVEALLITSFAKIGQLRQLAWQAIEKLVEKAGCFACVESLKKADAKTVQSFLSERTLENLLRFPEMRDKLGLATLLVSLGCSPLAKVHGTNVSLPRYALSVNEGTGVRLNQISVLYLMMGPTHFQRLRPKNGVWLPRELWILFHRYYFVGADDLAERELLLTHLENQNEEEVAAIEDLESFEDFFDENLVVAENE